MPSRPLARFALSIALAATAPFALEAQAVPLAAAFAVNQTSSGLDSDPAADASSSGDLFVSWTRQGSGGDGSGQGIFGRRFPAGESPDAEIPLNQVTAGDQVSSAVGMNASGDYVAVWSSFDQVSETSNFDIVARRSSSDGATLGNEFLVEESATLGSLFVAAVRDELDGAVIAWKRSDGTAIARPFDSIPAALSGDLTVASGIFNADPDVGVDADLGFVVAYAGNDADQGGIFARIYGASGVNPSEPFRVNAVETHSQSQPQVAVAANGEFVVLWTETDNATFRTRIEGRRFRSDGTPVGGDFPVSPEDGNDHVALQVDNHPDGSFVAAWQRQIASAQPAPTRGGRGDEGPTRVFFREFQRTALAVDGAVEEGSGAGIGLFSPAPAVSARSFAIAWIGPDDVDDGIWARRYLRRAIFADDFEGDDFATVWSAVVD